MAIDRISPMVPITDLTRALAFYRDGLGLAVVRRNDDWGWALLEGSDGCQVMIDRSIRDVGNSSTVVYYYATDLEDLRHRLADAGFLPDDVGETFYGMTEFRVTDPDGNQVWVGFRES